MSSYHWYKDGNPIGGATTDSYTAVSSGSYTVRYTNGFGCMGTSEAHTATLSFCADREVSPQGSGVPTRLVFVPTPPAGFYLYFEKVPLAEGYNIYEGTIGFYYSHGSPPDFACNAAVEDLGTGEMRSAVTPSGGDHYYLVTAFGNGHEGPSGFDSAGGQIPAGLSTCGP